MLSIRGKYAELVGCNCAAVSNEFGIGGGGNGGGGNGGGNGGRSNGATGFDVNTGDTVSDVVVVVDDEE